MDEQEILQLFFARNEAALTAVSALFGHRLQRLAQNIVHNEQDALECVNDTYLALWNSIPPQRPEPFAPYAMRVCKNIAISLLRKQTAQKRSGYEVALDELSQAIGGDHPQAQLEAQELGRAIDRFLDTIQKENRVIFLRRYWYGDSIEQIAKAMGMRENMISVRLSRTRSKLKTYLQKEGLL